jgi:hypothetical protein
VDSESHWTEVSLNVSDMTKKGVLPLTNFTAMDCGGLEFALCPTDVKIRELDFWGKHRMYRFKTHTTAAKAEWMGLLSNRTCKATHVCVASLKAIECPICLETWGSGNSSRIPTTLPCGHSLCMSHLPNITTCPICRASIPAGFNATPSYDLMSMASQVGSLCSQLEEWTASTRTACPAASTSSVEDRAQALRAEILPPQSSAITSPLQEVPTESASSSSATGSVEDRAQAIIVGVGEI